MGDVERQIEILTATLTRAQAEGTSLVLRNRDLKAMLETGIDERAKLYDDIDHLKALEEDHRKLNGDLREELRTVSVCNTRQAQEITRLKQTVRLTASVEF